VRAPIESEPEPVVPEPVEELEPEPELEAPVVEEPVIQPTVAEFTPVRMEPEEEVGVAGLSEDELGREETSGALQTSEDELGREEISTAPPAPPEERRFSIGMPEMFVYDGSPDEGALPSVGKADEREGVLEPSMGLGADVPEAPVEFVQPPEPEPEPPLAAAPVAEPEEKALPLISPDEAEATSVGLPEPEPTVADSGVTHAPEPEPVVTETMAELYAKQGLIQEAKGVYRLLLVNRPGDAHLRRRLEELDEAEPRVAVEPRKPDKYLAVLTGGESVRSMMDALLGGESEQTSADESGRVGTSELAPTSEVQTSEDESGRVGTSAAPAQEAPPDRGRSFSFDDFFGGGKPAEPQQPPAADEPGPEGPENEEFKDWLKGLKT